MTVNVSGLSKRDIFIIINQINGWKVRKIP